MIVVGLLVLGRGFRAGPGLPATANGLPPAGKVRRGRNHVGPLRVKPLSSSRAHYPAPKG